MSSLSAPRRDQLFGRWRLMHFLGEGGNGFVWLAQDSDGNQVAIKVLSKLEGRSSKVYERFKLEVEVVHKHQDIGGILPIIDAYLPEEICDTSPWYAMPVAQPLASFLEVKNIEDIVKGIIGVGETLSDLHDRGVSHRDIKPDNILVLENRFCLADFGLVDFPDKAGLTSTGEQIGAKWTIAPEMKRYGNEADGRCADVYSLAKTLWILLTGVKLGFDGQYNPASVNSLSRFKLAFPEGPMYSLKESPPVYLGSLEGLLRESTNDNPSERPTMKEFVARLRDWMETYRNFKRRNPLEWRDVQLKLFPNSVPQRAIWGNEEQIIQVLNLLGSIDNLNHMFLPRGGGMDMLGARLGNEENTIELVIGERKVYLLKPRRLIFESFGFDWEWNYFRLESENLEPLIDIDFAQRYHYEELVETEPLYYIERVYWDEGEYEGRELPRESRLVSRYIFGDFVIFQKTSMYNQIRATYMGIHNKMNSEEFRNYIENKISMVRELRNKKEILHYANENGLQVDEIITKIINRIVMQEYRQDFNKS
jgi:serine/threonine protein kinase